MNSSKTFPELHKTKGVLVVASSMEIGTVPAKTGSMARVEVTKFEAGQGRSQKWAVVLSVAGRVYLRPDEVPPLIAAIGSIIELPATTRGFDNIDAWYSTPSGNLSLSRSRQPGAFVNGSQEFIGLRYQINGWYTNDSEDLRRLQQLLQEARTRLLALQRGDAELAAPPNAVPPPVS